MKVLISAYACEPRQGSEQGSGWNWVKQIARFHETFVITRCNNRKPIECEIRHSKIKNIHFFYIDLPNWLKFWKHKERNLYLYYIIWQILVYFKARKLNQMYHFDSVHHLTFGSFWLPNFLAFLRIKFIWGPIGGAEKIPFAFTKSYTFINRLKERIRLMFIKFNTKLNPLFICNCCRADIIIAKTSDTAAMIKKRYKNKIYTLVGGGLPFNSINYTYNEKYEKNDSTVRILSVGRLIYLRNFDLGMKAFSRFRERYELPNCYTIVGGGSEEFKLKKLSQSLNLSDYVNIVGNKNRTEVVKYMISSDIFLFPSIKDAGPWVIFEAMYFGLPVICLDIAGLRDVIDSNCAIVIKPLNPEQTIDDIVTALIRLSTEPELRKKMGEAGRKRVLEHYDWEIKGELIEQIYEHIK